MRYIDFKLLEVRGNWPPEKWQERVRIAKGELKNLPEGKTRADIFRKYRDIWSDLKDDFKWLSHNKCWYCEVYLDGMRGDMDHHRPKGRVTENTDHPGYWWLAFEWCNFRLSCERCNSYNTDPENSVMGGKQNYFPLVGDESRRVWDECDYEDLINEDPLLLDPTEADDPQLLTFQPDGRPGPTTTDEKDPDYARVIGSIKIYHLYHSVSNRKRRRIYLVIGNLIRNYQKYHTMLKEDRSNVAARLGMKQTMSQLREMIQDHAEYASAARAYLDMHRRNEPEWAWLKGLH